jgi:hypothetical protein
MLFGKCSSPPISWRKHRDAMGGKAADTVIVTATASTTGKFNGIEEGREGQV